MSVVAISILHFAEQVLSFYIIQDTEDCFQLISDTQVHCIECNSILVYYRLCTYEVAAITQLHMNS